MVPGQVAQGCGAVLFLGVALQHGALLLHPWEQAAPEHWWLGPHPGWEPPLWAFCTLMLGWALTGIFHTSPVPSHQLHPSSRLAGAPLEREQRGAGAAGGCRRAPLLLSMKIDAARLRALPEQLLALPRSILVFFLSIKRRRSSSGPLLPRGAVPAGRCRPGCAGCGHAAPSRCQPHPGAGWLRLLSPIAFCCPI